MHPFCYYRNAPRNIPPNQYYVAPQPQLPPIYPYYVPYRSLPLVNTKMFIQNPKIGMFLLVEATCFFRGVIDKKTVSMRLCA
jgi:hypothetical protein